MRLALAEMTAEGDTVLELGPRSSRFAEAAQIAGRFPILLPLAADEYTDLARHLNFTPSLC
jgi:hypothetical protein